MSTKESILPYLGTEPSKVLLPIEPTRFARFTEIRLRTDKPLLLREGYLEYGVTADSRLVPLPADHLYITTRADITGALARVSRHSLYAFEEELRLGYITLPGGHRVGIAGQAVLDGYAVRTLRHISGLNFRVAHQVKGCAASILPRLLTGGTRPLRHTIVISPPGFGKTTLLRDIIRQISDGVPGLCSGMTVGVVDERSEIAGCYCGAAQNDVGLRTDVLDACPKAEGMVMLLRAMSPDVIAVDEIEGARDTRAAEAVLNAGIKLLCTAHGRDLDELRRKPDMAALMANQVFERYVVLGGPGRVEGVYDANGRAVTDGGEGDHHAA